MTTPSEAVQAVTEQLARAASADPGSDAPGPDASGPASAGPPPGLGTGRSGAALALAVLADDDPGLRRAAHGLLAQAAREPGAMRGGGLYSGAAAIAFAARTMVRADGEYRALLDTLTPRVAQSATARTAALRADLAAGAGLRAHTFDVVSGAAGLGRLLLTLEPDGPALAELLTALVELAAPHGPPRWWTAGSPGDRGHLNLGLAHGIPGPLALLSLARLHGVRVPGQEEAIDALATWLSARRLPSGGWPMTLPVEDEEAGRAVADAPSRAAWCYGTAGAARALHLAGTALDHPHWRTTAVTALTDALRDPSGWHLTGAGLCHGTGGLLRIVQRMAEDSGSPALASHLPALATATTRDLTSALAAGDPPTLLEGTAGAALALHAHTHPATPPTWDACLLIS